MHMDVESEPTAPAEISSTASSLITIWLVIHLSLLLLVCSSNLTPSGLQTRLVSVFRPYTRALNLDFTQLIGEDDGKFNTPYNLTHSIYSDSDHRIEILPKGADESNGSAWITLPDVGWQGGDRRRRYQRLADCFAYLSEFDDSRKAVLAQAICESFLRRAEVVPSQIRCRSHLGIELSLILDGERYDVNGPEYFRVEYAADTIVVGGSKISLNPKESQSQVARPGRSSRRQRSRKNGQ